MKENKALMREARETLSGRWTPIMGVLALCYAIMIAAGNLPFGSLLVYGPISVGIATYVLGFLRGPITMDVVWSGFRTLARSIIATLWQALFILLWTLALIIPGIMKAYAYSQLFFILAEDPTISAREALRKSERMMDGKKWKLFCLHCRFLGWAILSVITLCIGFLWFIPYLTVTLAKFYEDVKQEKGGEVHTAEVVA